MQRKLKKLFLIVIIIINHDQSWFNCDKKPAKNKLKRSEKIKKREFKNNKLLK